MFKGIGNLGSMLKQAQEMTGKLQGLNEELQGQRATGSAGGGLVTVEVNGLGEVLSVRIDPQLVEQNDREMIEDLLPAAVNAATAKAKQLHADAMRGMTEGLNLPGFEEAISRLTQGS